MRTAQLRIAFIAAALLLTAGFLGAVSFGQFASAEAGGPTVTLSSTTTSPTSDSSIPVTATFSEDVTGFDASDITLGGTASSSASGFASTSASVYTFNVDLTTDGTLTVQIPADIASSTATSTGNQASNVLSFTRDSAAPIISSIAVATTSSAATISFTTDESTTAQVNYGTTTSYGSTSATSTGTTHAILITGLTASTTYHYQIEAMDSAGSTATTADATFTTAASPVAPAISSIAVSGISSTSATVTWTTDLPSNSQVEYGTTTSYGSMTILDTALTTSHSVGLSDLSEGTLYHFAAISGTGLATTTSSDQTFVTQSTASSTPLSVDSTTADDTSAIADNSYADGWQWTMHLTVPDNEDAFRIRFSDWAQGSTTFAAAGNMRVYSAQSSNASSTSSALNIVSNGYDGWIYLTGDTAALTPGRQVDLVIQVKVPFGTATGSYTTFFTAQSWPSTATSTAPTI